MPLCDISLRETNTKKYKTKNQQQTCALDIHFSYPFPILKKLSKVTYIIKGKNKKPQEPYTS